MKNFDEFSDTEEPEIRERPEKRNAMRREKAEELRAKTIKVKQEDNKL